MNSISSQTFNNDIQTKTSWLHSIHVLFPPTTFNKSTNPRSIIQNVSTKWNNTKVIYPWRQSVLWGGFWQHFASHHSSDGSTSTRVRSAEDFLRSWGRTSWAREPAAHQHRCIPERIPLPWEPWVHTQSPEGEDSPVSTCLFPRTIEAILTITYQDPSRSPESATRRGTLKLLREHGNHPSCETHEASRQGRGHISWSHERGNDNSSRWIKAPGAGTLQERYRKYCYSLYFLICIGWPFIFLTAAPDRHSDRCLSTIDQYPEYRRDPQGVRQRCRRSCSRKRQDKHREHGCRGVRSM